RQAAIDKMIRAIDDYQIAGVETTLSFCRYVLKHEAFTSGNFDTNFVKHHFSPEKLDRNLSEDELEIAAIFSAFQAERTLKVTTSSSTPTQSSSKWRERRHH